MAEFSWRELQKCAEREVALRFNVFRKRGMTSGHQREIAMMRAIAGHFNELADAEDIAYKPRGPEALLGEVQHGRSPDVPRA